MKKNKLKMLLAATLLLTLAGCNYQIADVEYRYDKIHIYEDDKCYEIDSWRDYDGEQFQVKIKDGGTIVISSLNCILVKDKCPFCEE